jgi:CheY-like chemotaxis protein
LNLSLDKDRLSCSRSHPETEPQPKRSAKAACILVVEDNSGDVALIRQSLSEHGVGLEVVVMTDGEKAIRFMDEVDAGAAPCPALVSLDLNLPKRTGREVLQRIRESRFCRDVPVAIFSSSDDAKDKQVAASLGANRYIKKSSNLEDFLQIGSVLKTLLDEARR